MRVSFVIPAYNEEHRIGTCIESIIEHASREPEFLEIVVVNNASTDRTAEIARRYSHVRVVDEPAKGLTRARECGRRAAQGELLSYLDADARIHRGWFGVLRREFAKNPAVVSLSGPCQYYDLSGAKKFFAELGWHVAPISYFFIRHMVYGGNFTVKRSALEAIGGFNAAIDFYGEDMDLSWRLHRVGRVAWRSSFFVWNSGRRIVDEGLVRTYCRYALNVLWEIAFHKPFTHTHRDIRPGPEEAPKP